MLWSKCLSPQNSYVEILTPRDDGIRKCLGHEGGAFLNEINDLTKETPTELPGSFYFVRTQGEGPG